MEVDLPRFRGEVSIWDQGSGFGGNVSSFYCFLGPSFGSAENIFSFSNRDGKGKCKVIDLASLSSFHAIFSGLTAPQAFPRLDRRMQTPTRAGHVKAGRFAATEGLAFT